MQEEKLSILLHRAYIFMSAKVNSKVGTNKALVSDHLGHLKKVVVTRAGRLQEWALTNPPGMVKQWDISEFSCASDPKRV